MNTRFSTPRLFAAFGVLLSALLSFGSTPNSSSSVTTWSLQEAILQCGPQQQADDVVALLLSDAFLSSAVPGMVTLDDERTLTGLRHGADVDIQRAGANLPELHPNLSYVQANRIRQYVLSVSVIASSEKAAALKLHALIDVLTDMRSPKAAQVKEQRIQADQALMRAEAHVQEFDARLEKLIHECEGVDPGSWLAGLQDELQSSKSSLWSMRMKMDVIMGLREHYAGLLKKVPATVSVPGQPRPNPDFYELEARLEAAQTELSILSREQQAGESSLTDAINEMRRQITQLSSDIKRTPQQLPGPDIDQDNPLYHRREKDLLNAEEELAEASAKVAAMEKHVAHLTEEVLRYGKFADRQRRLESQALAARHQWESAKATVQDLEQHAVKSQHSLVQVVTGPKSASR